MEAVAATNAGVHQAESLASRNVCRVGHMQMVVVPVSGKLERIRDATRRNFDERVVRRSWLIHVTTGLICHHEHFGYQGDIYMCHFKHFEPALWVMLCDNLSTNYIQPEPNDNLFFSDESSVKMDHFLLVRSKHSAIKARKMCLF